MLSTLILVCLSIAHAHTDQEAVDAIDAYIRDIMTSESMVGLGVAVVREGRPLLARGYGVRHVTEGGDVTNETLWYLASCSKAVNAALVSKVLSEDGRYTFDTRVREIWPGFTLGSGFRSEHVTIRDLLGHRTGVVDTLMGVLTGAMGSRQDYLSRSQYFPTLYPFRDSESYNNLMVTAAGELAAILSGASSWENALGESLLEPLGMSQTYFVDRLTQEQYEAMATAHDNDGGAPRPISKDVFGPNLGPATPSGGLVTSAVDIQKWLLFLTNAGLAEDGSRVMNASDILRTMTETSLAKYPDYNGAPEDEIVYSETGVALGWYNGLYRGYNIATHGGYFFGFQSKVTVLPDLGMAVYTNINCPDGYLNGSVQYRVHRYVLDTLLGVTSSRDVMTGPTYQPSKDFSRVELNEMSELSQGKAENVKYAGTYGNFILGNMTVDFNATSGELTAYYGTLGVVSLVEVGVDSFLGIVQEPLWFAPPLPMEFASSDGEIYDQLTVPFLLPQAPPTFIRGLTMEAAPPPPEGSCEEPVF